MSKISACLVVYNEEKVIEKCLQSIKDLADEIIVVHDGECTDKTLEIVKKYTNKIFTRPHIGEAEPHRVFAMNQAIGEWILQIDADEYFDIGDLHQIKALAQDSVINGYVFKWELWNGKKAVYFDGLRKLCLFKKNQSHFIGIPHETVQVDGLVKNVDIFLHHRPAYSNISWKRYYAKIKKWAPIHAKYFFPEVVSFACFNTSAESWTKYVMKVRSHSMYYLCIQPIKVLVGQIMHGQYKSIYGIKLAFMYSAYHFYLFFCVYKLKKINS